MLDKKALAQFVEIDLRDVDGWYAKFSKHLVYLINLFKQDKSFSFEEAFVAYLVANLFDVKHVAELGVRYGISTRFWLTALPDCKLTGYDIKKLYKKRIKKAIKSPNFEFVQGDINDTWRGTEGVDMIFYDAHPYDLTYKIASTSMANVKIHCFHDVGSQCFWPESSAIPKDQRTDFKTHGQWERHVMAELFNPEIAQEEMVIGDEWRSIIIDSRYGVGITLHNSLFGAENESHTPDVSTDI